MGFAEHIQTLPEQEFALTESLFLE